MRRFGNSQRPKEHKQEDEEPNANQGSVRDPLLAPDAVEEDDKGLAGDDQRPERRTQVTRLLECRLSYTEAALFYTAMGHPRSVDHRRDAFNHVAEKKTSKVDCKRIPEEAAIGCVSDCADFEENKEEKAPSCKKR